MSLDWVLGFYNGMVIECHVLFEMTCDFGSRIGKRGRVSRFLEVVFGNMSPPKKLCFFGVQILQVQIESCGIRVKNPWDSKVEGNQLGYKETTPISQVSTGLYWRCGLPTLD